jgi:hypothetical protein
VRRARALAALALAGAAAPLFAGPPYLTDDPVPTDDGHWEIYAFAAGERAGAGETDFDADTGVDVNYGAVKGVQLTATLPLSFSREASSGWRGGTGDVELAVKYRFVDDKRSGFSAAIFPRAILPTSDIESNERTRFLLPLWVEKDFRGGTSLFGGGGYMINPGPGNRNFWQAAVALTHDLDERVSIGGEITRQGPDDVDSTAQTRAGAGAIIKLTEHQALLVSGGPTWEDHQTGYHIYAALGLNF